MRSSYKEPPWVFPVSWGFSCSDGWPTPARTQYSMVVAVLIVCLYEAKCHQVGSLGGIGPHATKLSPLAVAQHLPNC